MKGSREPTAAEWEETTRLWYRVYNQAVSDGKTDAQAKELADAAQRSAREKLKGDRR